MVLRSFELDLIGVRDGVIRLFEGVADTLDWPWRSADPGAASLLGLKYSIPIRISSITSQNISALFPHAHLGFEDLRTDAAWNSLVRLGICDISTECNCVSTQIRT